MAVELTEDELYELSDEELEAAFRDAKAGMAELDEDVDNDVIEEGAVEDDDVDTTEEYNEYEDEVADDDEEVEGEDDEAEQPGDDEDSDDQDENEDDIEDEEEPSEEPDEDEEDNSDADEDESEPEPEVKKYKYKANGQDFEFTEDEIKDQFGKIFGMSMNYTQKMQEIAPWRKTISALKDNDLGHDDVNLMIDVMKGNKEAIAEVVKRNGIDIMDLDSSEERTYAPSNYGRSEQELAIDDVIGSIEKDQEFAVTQHVVDRQWDSRSREMLAKQPQMIQGLHNDVKSGVYDAVSPIAMKLKVLDGGTKSDLEYYIEAGEQYYEGIRKQESIDAAREEARAEAKAAEAERVKAEQEKVNAIKQKKASNKATQKAANKRRAAAPTKKAAGKKDVIDYLDDESFIEWEKEYKRKYG